MESVAQIAEFRELLTEFSPHLNPICMPKIETVRAIENLPEIHSGVDSVMLGRGDLGIIGDYTQLGVYQEYVIQYCKANKKKIFVATDIMDSLEEYNVPSRADLLDLYYLLSSEVDGLVTSAKNAQPILLKRFCNIVRRMKNSKSGKGVCIHEE